MTAQLPQAEETMHQRYVIQRDYPPQRGQYLSESGTYYTPDLVEAAIYDDAAEASDNCPPICSVRPIAEARALAGGDS